MIKDKKAQIKSILLFMIVIFAVGFTIILGKFVLTQFTTAFEETVSESEMDPDVTTDVLDSMATQYATFDYAMVIMVIAMIIGLIITSYMIPTHPIFVVINILGIFILVFVGMLFVNIYGQLINDGDAELATTVDSFSFIPYLITFLPFIGAIAILITSIIMYVRGSSG
jgi:hypothetical protein